MRSFRRQPSAFAGNGAKRTLRRRGWDGRTRTYNIRVKVWCVTVTLHPTIEALRKEAGFPASRSRGVGDGARTHDTRNHNPVLCQLSYTHHNGLPARKVLCLRAPECQAARRVARLKLVRSANVPGAHLPDKVPSEEGEACFASGVPKAGHHRHSSKG